MNLRNEESIYEKWSHIIYSSKTMNFEIYTPFLSPSIHLYFSLINKSLSLRYTLHYITPFYTNKPFCTPISLSLVGCLPVYTNLTDGIGWLLDSFVGEIKSFKKSVKLSHQLNNNTENEIRRLSMYF